MFGQGDFWHGKAPEGAQCRERWGQDPLRNEAVGPTSGLKAGYKEGTIEASSTTFTVVGEAVFDSLRKNGPRLSGRRSDAEAPEEVRPDAECGRHNGWGYIGVQCT